MKKILSFATYPIANPQHGGQKRIAAIMNEYRKAGIDARFVAIYHDMFYKDSGPYDIAISGEEFQKVLSSPFTGDVICGEAIYSNPAVKKQVIKTIQEFQPDAIDIHQAFPYLGLEPLLAELKLDIPVMFNSHNIEYAMKEEMLVGLGWSKEDVANIVNKILLCEQKLAKNAVLATAVSSDDARVLNDMGAREIIVAPNGINKIDYIPERVNYWRSFFAKQRVDKIALFVGSAHPPNWFGFKEMVGLGLGFITPQQRVVLAGSIGEYVESEVSKIRLNPAATTFWKRAWNAGRLSQEKLEGLINFADVILLPITEGGGSNLKTAEAVISGKKVVATNYAFRGFEALKNLPNIYIANDQNSFVSTINYALKSKLAVRDTNDQELANQVLWKNCLKNFIEAVRTK